MVIDNINVYGIENAIRGSKYPMATDLSKVNSEMTRTVVKLGTSRQGEGHDNFLNGIVVQFDLTFTVKAWTEAERYHFLDFISSQSTMHRITKFDLDKSYIEYVDPRVIEIMKEKVDDYNWLADEIKKWQSLGDGVNMKEGKELLAKKYLEILYTNPCGFKLTAAMTTNYRQLKTIYHQRKLHKLPEWKCFCEQIEQLPYFKELVLGEE